MGWDDVYSFDHNSYCLALDLYKIRHRVKTSVNTGRPRKRSERQGRGCGFREISM